MICGDFAKRASKHVTIFIFAVSLTPDCEAPRYIAELELVPDSEPQS